MTAAQFRAEIAALGLSLGQAATVLGLHPVTVRAFSCGRKPVPVTVQQWLRFAGAVEPNERALILSTMLAGAKPREARDAA
jgi:formylglycine-generating enzyme required for sulfatase activity